MASEAKGRGFDPRQPHQTTASNRAAKRRNVSMTKRQALFPKFARLLAMASCFCLAACAVPVQNGASQDAVLARYGTPSAVVPLPTGTRLQYSTQPFGRTALMVDLDASGRVVSANEVMNLKNFFKIGVGSWTRADVEREFGRPGFVDHVASWPGDILNYRWLDIDTPMLFWIYLDSNNVVQRTAQGFDRPFPDRD